MKSLLTLLLIFTAACSYPQADSAPANSDIAGQVGEAVNQQQRAQTPSPAITPTPDLNVAFGNGLRVVPKEINLENQKLRYKIDVTYPQIEGAKNTGLTNLNQQIKRLVTEAYSWPLHPGKQEIRYSDMHQDAFNTVDLSYEVSLATTELLSICFIVYSYGIGAVHSVQYSFTVNYELKSGKILRLADIFKPHTNYLRLISQYCLGQLTKHNDVVFKEALTPKAKNYESWNITKEGLRINFDACSVLGCSSGVQKVTVPFAALSEVLPATNSVVSLLQ